MTPETRIAIEGGNTKESYERAQVLQPVLNWGSSKAPTSVSLERKDGPELLCRLMANRMRYSNLDFSTW